MTFAVLSIALLPLISFPAHSQSLGDVLRKSKGQGDLDETQKAWASILEQLRNNTYTTAIPALKNFNSIRTDAEPYQKTFCQLALKILEEPPKTQKSSSGGVSDPQQELLNKIDALKQRAAAEEAKKPGILARMREADRTGVAGPLDSPSRASEKRGLADAEKAACNRELNVITQNVYELRVSINTFENKIESLQRAAENEAQRLSSDSENTARNLEQKVSSFVRELNRQNRFSESIILASMWINKKGQDGDLTELLQESRDMQKTAAEVNDLARAALQPVNALVQQNKLWQAKVLLEESIRTIRSQVTDPSKRNHIEEQMNLASSDLREKLVQTQNQRNAIINLAEEDALSATPKLEEFRKQYPDYPEAERDKVRLDKLRIQQVEHRLDQKLNSIDRVAVDDPQEALVMLQKLIDASQSEDETFVLKAKFIKVTHAWIEKRTNSLRNNLLRAGEIYEEYGRTHPDEVNPGWIPSLTSVSSSDVEPLVYAVGVKQRSMAQVESLLKEKIDEETRQELSALLATEKIKLRAMEKTLSAHTRNRIATIVISAVVLIGVGSLAVYAWFKFRKKPALAPTVPSC